MSVKAALVVLAAVFITCEGGSESGAPGPDPALATPIDSLLAAAEDRYWSGDIAAARVSFQAALARSRRIADGPGEARALTWLGLAAYRLGDHPEARLRGEEALTLKLRLGLDEELAKSYSALGLLAFAEGRYFDAVELHGQALEIAEVVADTVAATKARTNLGLAYTELGDFHRARQLFIGALQGARVLDDPLIEGRVLTNLGMLAVRTGDPAAAIRYLRAARGPLREAEDVVGEQNAIGQLGTAWGAIGEPGRAIATLDTALQMSRDQGLRQEESSNLEALAELHREAGDLRRGLALFREARAINEVLGLEDETGADLRSEAEIHAALGNLDLALRAGRAALEIHRRVGSRFAELIDLLLLADLSRDAGRPGEAEDFLRQARATAIDLDAPSARATVALAEARSAEARDLPRRVLAILRENEPVLPAAGADAAWESHALAARAFARIGQADSAVAAGWRAVAAVERLRGGYASGSLRTSFTATRGAVYLRLVEDLIRLGRIEEAFEIADRSHGRALLEHVSTLRSDGGATVRELAEEERQLLERIDELTAWSREARAEGTEEPALDEERERLAAELERTREAYAAALIRAEERQGGSAALLGGGVPDARRIRAAIGRDETLLEYIVGSESVHLFVVTRDTVRVFESPVERPRLAARVRIVRELLALPDRDPEAGWAALGALHEILLGHAILAGVLEPGSRLIVVPDGELTYVPFAALRDPGGRYLVERHALVHLPSASALPHLRSVRTGPAPISGAIGFAPFPSELRASGLELDAFRRVVPGAREERGGRATEGRFREALARRRIVHAASHGVLNARNPLFSSIVLEPGSDGGPADDGRFEVHEVISVRIRASLVYLSGCETAAGPAWATGFSRGEDYATLARAFLYAGADDVVATLWRVEDRGAATFAEGFYNALFGGRASGTAADALAATQRRMLASTELRAPYYWAGYRVSGGSRPW